MRWRYLFFCFALKSLLFKLKESESDDTANCFQSFGFRITLPPPNLCPQRPPCDPEVSAIYECWKFLILDGNNAQCKIESESESK